MRRFLWPFVSIAVCLHLAGAQLTASIGRNEVESTTSAADGATGKLSQFRSFQTPKPFPPPNANFMYASVWASWSAWSFCAGKVQVRVRACNTVRGYSCPGPNRETKPCEIPRHSAEENAVTKPAAESPDFDHNDDPWAADRREALRQLYADYDAAPGVKPPRLSPKSAEELRRLQTAGRLPLSVAAPANPKPPASPRPLPPRQHAAPQLPGNPPSMTPELLYERKAAADGGADEAKAAARLSGDKPRPPPSLHDADSPPNTSELRPPPATVDRDIDRSTQMKHRDHQQVTSSIAVHGPPSSEWNVGPGNHVRRPPPTRPPPSTTGFTTRQSPPPPTSAQPKRGDSVQLSSSVQQHFKAPPEPQGTPSVQNAEVALRDPTVPPPSVAGSIHEEPLGDALDGTSGEQQAAPTSTPASAAPTAILDGGDKHQPSNHFSSQSSSQTTSPPPLPIARRPTEAEVARIAEKLEHDQRSGEAGAPRDERPPLHSGEVTPRRSAAPEQQPVVDVDTVKALEWMLKNMSAAAKAATTTTTTTTAAPAPVRELIDNGLRRRYHASKTMHAGGNPDEEERAIAAELKRLHTDMQQMESELKELQAAEPKPRFDQEAATNLNLVPKVLTGPLVSRGPTPKVKPLVSVGPSGPPPSVFDEQPRFLLDDIRLHSNAARWSDFGPWGECICGKRLRTRSCIYDPAAHSQGCSGKSYERESCVGGRACPASGASAPASTSSSNLRIERKPTISAATTTRLPRINARPFHSSWTSARPSDRSDLFYPNPLPQPQFRHHHKRW